MNGVDLVVTEAGDAGAPPVICAHGFPELAYSWRHTLPALAGAGYHPIAPDLRGYGHSSAPTAVAAYGSDLLASDLIGLLDETGARQGVFVGHDWGALIVWDLVRLHPERVRAVVGVSVPFVQWPVAPTELFRSVYRDRFFYMLYFQAVGPAEREFDADPRRTLNALFWSASAEGSTTRPARDHPAVGTAMLDTLTVPAELPAWLSPADMDHYVAEFTHSGFFGPVSYYRNLDANWERVRAIPASVVSMPSFFISGADDPVGLLDRHGLERMRARLPGFSGAVVIPGCGHWTQQEAPTAFNEALLGFLATLPPVPRAGVPPPPGGGS